jgi:GNAT superfamily N-acetyltransferase
VAGAALVAGTIPLSAAEFAGDCDATALHFAATIDGDAVPCRSLYASQWTGRSIWQLRGMATDASFQGQGIGRLLLDYTAVEAVAAQPSWPIGCNARVSAIGFYRKANWTVESE